MSFNDVMAYVRLYRKLNDIKHPLTFQVDLDDMQQLRHRLLIEHVERYPDIYEIRMMSLFQMYPMVPIVFQKIGD